MKKILLILALSFLTGCVSMSHKETTKDGIVLETHYSRFGSMSISNAEFKTGPNKTSLSIDRSNGDLGQITEVLNKALDIAAKGVTP